MAKSPALPRRLEYVPVEDLPDHPRNPRDHDLPELIESVRRFGFTSPPMVDERTGLLAEGHGRKKATLAIQAAGEPVPDGVLVEQGRWLVPVVRGWQTSDDTEAEAYLLAGNQGGGWHDDTLVSLLSDLAEADALAGTQFTTSDLDALLAQLNDSGDDPAPEPSDPDAIPDPPPPITRTGDVWLLGPHRVLCGDARSIEHVELALAGERPALAFTSPPYASQRTYDERSEFRPIHPDQYVEWFRAVADNVAAVLADDGSWFVNIKDHAEDGVRHRYVLDLFVDHIDRGWLYVDGLVWPRPAFPIDPHAAGRFKNGWEPIQHFTRARRHKFHPDAVMVESDSTFTYDPERKLQGNKTSGFLGVGRDGKVPGYAYPSNVLPHFGVAKTGTDHPAAFPVGLPEWFVKAYTDPGDVVLDPFIGSGSTLIAAHRQGRVGVGIETSPRYVDTLCKRWQLYTSERPVLDRTGKPHDFTAG